MREIGILDLATLVCGLIAGAFFAFSTFVMKARSSLPPAQGIAAMQSINLVVINPWFLGPFVGTAAACVVMAIVAPLRWHDPRAPLWIAGSLLYVVGTFLVTMVFNVPRSNALAVVAPSSAEAARLWTVAGRLDLGSFGMTIEACLGTWSLAASSLLGCDGAAGGGVMQFSVEPRGDALIVRVHAAKLTYPVLSTFFAEVRALVADGARKLVIDLEAVTYIDSATIGCLMEIHRLLEDHGGAVKLSGLQRRVETMLTMTGVHKIVHVCRDEAEALAAFPPRRPLDSERARGREDS